MAAIFHQALVLIYLAIFCTCSTAIHATSIRNASEKQAYTNSLPYGNESHASHGRGSQQQAGNSWIPKRMVTSSSSDRVKLHGTRRHHKMQHAPSKQSGLSDSFLPAGQVSTSFPKSSSGSSVPSSRRMHLARRYRKRASSARKRFLLNESKANRDLSEAVLPRDTPDSSQGFPAAAGADSYVEFTVDQNNVGAKGFSTTTENYPNDQWSNRSTWTMDSDFMSNSARLRPQTFNFTWPAQEEASIVEGHLVLGALHMIHERSQEYVCGHVMEQGGIQALEAMLYTLDYVNGQGRAPPLIPGVKLGILAKDDCDTDILGLEQALDFIRGIQDLGDIQSSLGQQAGGKKADDLEPTADYKNSIDCILQLILQKENNQFWAPAFAPSKLWEFFASLSQCLAVVSLLLLSISLQTSQQLAVIGGGETWYGPFTPPPKSPQTVATSAVRWTATINSLPPNRASEKQKPHNFDKGKAGDQN
ncbi:hypothetical protein PoB_004855200 [Plakobranchus ocellatus]|uniref:Receptor ligand binding region domain-containing protein n=1 Tax=Plakobranchus ocellatus TaxID=259542 RepID=A0AAV4BRS7_9GAST|nr:hypothetical protein PoB_004855200 [Plakobranchus ocellatus]